MCASNNSHTNTPHTHTYTYLGGVGEGGVANRQKGQLFEGSSICYDATVAGAAFIVVAGFFARNSRNKIVEQSGNTQKSIVLLHFSGQSTLEYSFAES